MPLERVVVGHNLVDPGGAHGVGHGHVNQRTGLHPLTFLDAAGDVAHPEGTITAIDHQQGASAGPGRLAGERQGMELPPPLATTIDRYIASLDGAGYSPNTLKAYSTRLTDYLRWLTGASDELQPAAVQSADTIQQYLASLRHRRIGRRIGVSGQTLSHAFAILSGFHRWMERTLRIEPNPMRDVLRPRTQTSVDVEFQSLTAPQLEQLLHTAAAGWPTEHGPPDMRTQQRRDEDWLLLAFMGLAGLRVSEVCALDRADIDDDVVHVLGKGRKRRAVPLAPEILEMLDRYQPPGGVRHLFGRPTDPGRRIAPYAVEQRVPRLARRAGITELRVTPHVLRHTFGSLMLAADPNALVPTRDLMGHESVETTNKYAHTRDADRRLALASMRELRERSRR